MVVRPKDQNGLGIIETKIMNEYLLVKWTWKFLQGSNDIWYRILQSKTRQMITFNSKHKGNSQLWQGLHEFNAFVQMRSYLQGTQWQEELFPGMIHGLLCTFKNQVPWTT
jgi:hypothetical protein